MDRKTVLAIVLVVLIAYLYPQYQKWVGGGKKGKTAQIIKKQDVREAKAIPEPAPKPMVPPVIKDTLKASQPVGAGIAAVPATVDSSKIQQITVENQLYYMTLSTVGPTISSCRFKQYKNDNNEWVDIIPPGSRGTLNVTVKGSAGEVAWDRFVFDVNKTKIVLDGQHPVDTLALAAVTAGGFTLKRKFIFYHDKYYFRATVAIGWDRPHEFTEYGIHWLPGLAPTETDVKRDVQTFASCYKKTGEKVVKKKFKNKVYTDRGRIEWVATKTKYFTLALVPESFLGTGQERGMVISEEEAEKDIKKVISLTLKAPLENRQEHSYQVYLGPKDYDILKSVGVGLEDVMNLGWSVFRPIALVIQKLLLWLHNYIPNYGVVLIVFSIILKVAFYPLTHKSFTATKDMQKLQPLMAEIKEKYKGDTQRINQETMKLYKQHGVNPLGGCLPMLLQMPVFIALFKVFDTNIEFRRAEFIWWIKDLSRPDPTFILPIFMGVTMFVQQKLTGSDTTDERQKIMMYMMPIVFTFIFLRLSSGLILYYTVFNILSIAQQYLINYKEKKNKNLAPKKLSH